MSGTPDSQSEYLAKRAKAYAVWRAKTEFVQNCARMSAPEAQRILDEALRAAGEAP